MSLPFASRIAKTVIAVYFALLVITRTVRGDETSLRPPTATIGDIRRLIQAQRERLVSLRAEFRSWFRGNLGTDRCEHHIVAAKTNRRYAHLWHGEYPNPEDDPRAHIRLFDGENWNVFSPYFRRYDVSRKFAIPPYTDKIHLHPLFESLGWWPPDDPLPPTRPSGRTFFIHDVLEDGRCRVLGQELVDGAWCHVVELPETDRLWIDCDRGTVPRRVLYTKEDQRSPIVTFELSDFRAVAPGILLPYRFRRVFHPSNWDIISLVEHYDVNPVPDDQFRLDVPPGTVIWDRDTDRQGQIPGGFEIMDRLVAWEKGSVEPHREPRGRAVLWAAMMGIGGFVTGLAASRGAKACNGRSSDVRPTSWWVQLWNRLGNSRRLRKSVHGGSAAS